ncbi:hypothetical protein, partial [Methylobacterium indicum]|uniref:hypothetical protein n=1 Tax=Methylobacterium indicum TaxID=1775910 RepID=UPI001A958157
TTLAENRAAKLHDPLQTNPFSGRLKRSGRRSGIQHEKPRSVSLSATVQQVEPLRGMSSAGSRISFR